MNESVLVKNEKGFLIVDSIGEVHDVTPGLLETFISENGFSSLWSRNNTSIYESPLFDSIEKAIGLGDIVAISHPINSKLNCLLEIKNHDLFNEALKDYYVEYDFN